MKRLMVGAVVAAALFAGMIPAASAYEPAVHEQWSALGDTFVCEGATYTVTSGMVEWVYHGTAANFTTTLTLKGVMATDGTSTFRIVGSWWVGGTFNGTGTYMNTARFQIIGPDGSTDSVIVTYRINGNGDVDLFDFGSCNTQY